MATVEPTYPYLFTSTDNYDYSTNYSVNKKVVRKETKEQRQARIALDKHYAGMSTFNEVRPKIIQVKRNCMPRHKICY